MEPAAPLKVIAAAALFSTGGAAIKACSLTGMQVAGLRSGIAALTLLVLLPAARRRWSASTLVIGATYAATLISYVLANKLTTAAGTIFLQSTAPLYLLLLGPWLLREPVHRRDIAFIASIAIGMVMFFVGTDAPLATAPDPFLGNIFGALSGILWALTLTGFRWVAREHREAGSAAVLAFAGNLLVALACLPSLIPLPAFTAADLAVIPYLGIFQIGLAYVFLVGGIRHVHALTASLLLLIEPVLNPIWAWLFQSEIPGPWTLTGGCIILATTTVKALTDTRRKPITS